MSWKIFIVTKVNKKHKNHKWQPMFIVANSNYLLPCTVSHNLIGQIC